MEDICQILCSTINRSVCTSYQNKNISTFLINVVYYYKVNLALFLGHPIGSSWVREADRCSLLCFTLCVSIGTSVNEQGSTPQCMRAARNKWSHCMQWSKVQWKAKTQLFCWLGKAMVLIKQHVSAYHKAIIRFIKRLQEENNINACLCGSTRCTNFSNLFWNETLHVSDSSSAHHQEFFPVHTAMVYVIQSPIAYVL
jgi:hypothetical protein